MFVIGGIGALIVWYLRKSLPELPRWLEAVGRTEEAEALMQSIETRSSPGTAAAGASAPRPFRYPATSRRFSRRRCCRA